MLYGKIKDSAKRNKHETKGKKVHISSCKRVMAIENTTHNYSKLNKQRKYKEKERNETE